MPECKEIFHYLKVFFAAPPIIQKSNVQRPIIIYLAVSEEVVNTTSVQEVKKKERSVYFISRVLHGIEICYQMIEKVTLVLVVAT